MKPEEYDKACERLSAVTQEIDGLLGTDEKPRTEPLTAEDRTKLDELETEAGTLNTAIEQHKADEAARQRQAARKQHLATTSAGRLVGASQPATETAVAERETYIAPKLHEPLYNFKGEAAHRDAYWAGMQLLGSMFQSEAARNACLSFGIPEKYFVHQQEKLSQSEGSDTAGGFLVLPEFERTIIDLRLQYGTFRRESKVVPMASDTKTVPRRVSGLTAYYVGEGVEITESEMAWDQIRLTARKLAVMSKYSTEIDEDSIRSMADTLAGEMAYAMAKEEDEAGWIGDGTSTYGRMVGASVKINDGNHSASIQTAVAGNTAFSTLDLADFEAMTGKLPDYADDNAKWYIHKAGWAASMLRLLNAAGGNTADVIAGTAPKYFLGYPVVLVNVLNSTLTAQTSTVLALFGDLRKASTFGSRRGIRVDSTKDRYWENDMIGIKATERYHINVHDLGDTSDAGPLLALKTPSA